MSDRIAQFAEALTPALAGLAGEAIHRASGVELARRSAAVNALFDIYKVQGRQHAAEWMIELFAPQTPWSEESAVAAGQLLYGAFCYALEQPEVWDRRLAPGRSPRGSRPECSSTSATGGCSAGYPGCGMEVTNDREIHPGRRRPLAEAIRSRR